MIHIVFNEADVSVLNEAIALDETLAGDVLQIKDDFAVGPIDNLHSPEGVEARKEFWRQALAKTDLAASVDNGSVDDSATVTGILDRLRENAEETVWIWAAQNKHDVCGYYWLLPWFKELQGRIFILYLNNLPFINEKGGIFYPDWLHQIPAKEFLKAKKLAREITLSEFEVDTDEWQKLSIDGKGIRILEGGKKLAQFDYDYYDGELKKYVMPDWQKATKVVHHFLTKAKETTGDSYLYWRLTVMATQGSIELKTTDKLKDWEVKNISGFAPEAQVL